MIAFAVSDWLPGVLSFIFGGGLVAAIVQLYKVKPEAGQIVVTTAQGALIVQSGVIENLHKEITRLRDELAKANEKIEAQAKIITSLTEEVWKLKTIQGIHDAEVKDLQHKAKE